MEKTKLGISVALLSALTFLSGYLGITVLVLLAGYILIREENVYLKKTAVGTVVLYLAFAALSICIVIPAISSRHKHGCISCYPCTRLNLYTRFCKTRTIVFACCKIKHAIFDN